MTSYTAFLANETERADQRRVVQNARESVVLAGERVVDAVRDLHEGGGSLPALTAVFNELVAAERDLGEVEESWPR